MTTECEKPVDYMEKKMRIISWVGEVSVTHLIPSMWKEKTLICKVGVKAVSGSHEVTTARGPQGSTWA